MHQYQCLIIEDEPLAAEVLQDYIRQVPFLHLRRVCPDAIFALEELQQGHVDLIFLDIHLPKLKGFDFLKTLKRPPAIIITTAYHEFALQGYEYNVLDYLLKPVEFSRFLAAVNKLHKQTPAAIPVTETTQLPAAPSLFFHIGKKKVRIALADVLYIESLKEYIRIVTKEKSFTAKMQLGQAEEIFPRHEFIRIHRSFIVAKNKIEAFTATDIEINHQLLPIGRSYKELVMAVLDKA
ncbi:MAG TPA: LytTR family DNA-binding domain-containing protein [Chitinophagaceae bacterium]|nr:LytTR family DNA-binding domain-containing protein [Chitinophagaceae bacterium]